MTGQPGGDRRCCRRDLQGARADARHCRGHLGLWRSGMQFDTTVNEWHTCPETDRINASNPCSEYMFLDDSACNLASINLMKFVKEDGEFDVAAFKAACRTSSPPRRSSSRTRAIRPWQGSRRTRTSIVRSVSATPTSRVVDVAGLPATATRGRGMRRRSPR